MHLHSCNLYLRLYPQALSNLTLCPPTEKGPWAAVLQEGYDAFQGGDYQRAMLHYLQASEMGLELGQSNAAWLLTHVSPLPPPPHAPISPRLFPHTGWTQCPQAS